MGILITARLSGEREIRAALDRLSKRGRSLRRPLGRIALFGAKRAGQRLRQQHHIDRGTLVKDVGSPRNIRSTDTSATYGSSLPYAAIRQLGGTILPKRGKALAIPIAKSMKHNSPKDFPRSFFRFVPARGGGKTIGYLMRAEDKAKRRGKIGKKGELLFVLVKWVKQTGDVYLMFGPDERKYALAELKREYLATIKGKGN
jgi:hypothetical protein